MLEIPIEQLAGQSDDPSQQASAAERLALFGTSLDGLFRVQVGEKSLIEERWLKDLRQYNGEYDDDTLTRIRASGGSEAFVNLTRVKCNAAEARMGEMLLPTDDRNWSIEPTPVPELQRASRDRSFIKDPATGQPQLGPDGKPTTVADAVQQVIKQAKAASDRMQDEMDDQLSECGYNAVIRRVIHYMVVYGTGILKGPVIRNRLHKGFKKTRQTDPDTGLPVESWQIDISEDLKPGAECVSPWDFFPDMRATRMEECEFVFERHRFNSQKLRDLAKLPGFNKEVINDLLALDPDKSMAGMVDRSPSADNLFSKSRGKYEVIEYHGPIKAEDLIAAGVEVDPEDHLTSYEGTVWFCKGKVMKACLSMLDSGELMYDTIHMERDDTSLFGFGIPQVMRHSQKSGNAAWRMILDNARLSVGGQVVFKEGKVSPVNGDYRLGPFKVWKVTDPNLNVADAFTIVETKANFQGMFQIFESVRALTDEETGLPMIAQGQQSPTITKTAQGMSLLMNSANTVLRRLVKEFDDAITQRFITRLYQWNMQYGQIEEAKGDFDVIALGSSSLLVREQQSQGLMQLAQLGGSNPEFAQRMKWGELLRTTVKGMNINADGLVKTDEELEFEKQQAAQQPPQMPPEIQLKMAQLELGKAELQLKQADLQARAHIDTAKAEAEIQQLAAKTETERQKIAADVHAAQLSAQAHMADAQAAFNRTQVDYNLAVMKLAAERDMTVQEVQRDFGLAAMEISSRHELANAQMAMKARMNSGTVGVAPENFPDRPSLN